MYFRESEILRQRHPDLGPVVDAVDDMIGRARVQMALQVTVSFVAKRVGRDEHDVGVVVDHLAAGGVLNRKFLFRCPVRTSGVRLYDRYDQVPEVVTCDLCDAGEHKRDMDDVFVVYVASRTAPLQAPTEEEGTRRPFAEGAIEAPSASDSVASFGKGIRGAMELKGLRPTILILTALTKELAAVLDVLDAPSELADSANPNVRFQIGTVPALDGRHCVAVAVLSAMGNTSAGTYVATLAQQLPYLADVIMVGIAGGVPCPEKPEVHVRLGDVVVSRSVVEFDLKKEKHVVATDGDGATKIELRGEPKAAAAKYATAMQHVLAKELRGDRSWFSSVVTDASTQRTKRPQAAEDRLHDAQGVELAHPVDVKRVPELPRLFFGCIASSNTLLKNPLRRDELAEKYGALAVEMEGAGVASAAWMNERSFCLVRGVCDYCDSYKNDLWQEYAALVAAVFCRSLLGRFSQTAFP